MAPHPWPHLAVVKPRRDTDLQLDRSLLALDHPHDPTSFAGAGAARGTGVVGEREEIEQPGLSAAAPERRLQNQRVVEVPARALPLAFLADRCDRAAAAVLEVE